MQVILTEAEYTALKTGAQVDAAAVLRDFRAELSRHLTVIARSGDGFETREPYVFIRPLADAVQEAVNTTLEKYAKPAARS